MISLEPIGFVRTGKTVKFEAGHQPDHASEERNRIVLQPGRQFDLALQDLEGFDHIWLIWWFHQNANWRPRVLPPRGPATRRGVMATRSPHRPNPLGLTCVRLYAVHDLELEVGPLDLLDGTPILDIKPYLPAADSFPESKTGWVGEMEAGESHKFRVEVLTQAEATMAEMREAESDAYVDRALALLANSPEPHRTRRILQLKDGRRRLACGRWRIFFRFDANVVCIESVEYRSETADGG